MFRFALSTLFALIPAALAAQCTGALIDERLSPAETDELAQAIAATPYPQGLLWRAEKGDRDIVLVGTFHLADPRNRPLLDRIAPLVLDSDKVLVEITTAGEAELQAHLAGNTDLLLLPDNGTLIGRLPPETWADIVKAAEARSIPAVMAARLQPWYLTMTLAVPACAMASLSAGERGVDAGILGLADRAGIPVGAVEDWRAALDMLRQGSFDEQVQMLELMLADPELQAEAMASMIDHYYKGEVAEIWELSRITSRWLPGLDPAEADALFETFSEALLVQRNRAWVPVILKEAETLPSVLVAVGAAHLPGKDGLLRALEDDGWTISRLD